ncbi:Mg2+ transporter protein cora-like protein [Atractiella rhizophila]|nr:Mg2+ transporter protein cora-like protein [Atractiella rhizophila]
MRCTVLDEVGNVQVISGQFRKTELCSEHGLQPRDLRKIDSRVPNVVPTILVRKECILVNMLHIRALIKHDSIYLFDSYGTQDTSHHSLFLYNLGHNLRLGAKASGGLPYEFRALEAIFASVTQALESEMTGLRTVIVELLEALEIDIDREKLKLLLHYSRKLSVFHKVAKLVQESFDEVLEQDEDLAAMYLTEKNVENRPRASDDHEELELLLESFSKQVEEMVSEAENLIANVKSTEEIVDLILDSNRNQLLSLDLKVSIGTMGIGSGALVASMFGMNLKSGFENHEFAFYLASTGAVALSVLMAAYGIRRLHKLRKVGIGIGVARMGIQEGLPVENRLVVADKRQSRLAAAIKMKKRGFWQRRIQ